jgi:hypothetical protein
VEAGREGNRRMGELRGSVMVVICD